MRWFGCGERVREVDLAGERIVAVRNANLPAAFRPVGIVWMGRLAIARDVSPHPVLPWNNELSALRTGHATATVVLDGPPAARLALDENAPTAPSVEVAAARARGVARWARG